MESPLQYISKLLFKVLEKNNLSHQKIYSSFLNYSNHADIDTNIAFFISKETGKDRNQIAKELAEKILKDKAIDKVEVVNGYINIYLTKEFIQKKLLKTISPESIFDRIKRMFFNKKVTVEHTDPNFFKELHVGHLMSNSIGESLSRIKEFNGDDVKRMNYSSDIGLNTAQSVWAAKKNNSKFTSKNLSSFYLEGKRAFGEDEESKMEIQEINKQIYTKSDSRINKIYKNGVKVNKEYLNNMYKKLESKFDNFIYESETAEIGLKEVKEGLLKKVFVKENGAIIYKGKSEGLHTRVFVNQQGLPTYETKEVGLAIKKNKIYKGREHFIVTSTEIQEYVKVVYSAIKKLHPDIAENTAHLTHGFLLSDGKKMSSRKYNSLPAEDLIEELKVNARNIAEENNIKMSDRDVSKIALSAFRFSVLKQSLGKNVNFDKDKVVSFTGDTGPYLQYSMVRASKLLKISKHSNKPYFDRKLSILIISSNDVFIKAYKENSPSVIAQYLLKLAHQWNSFYERDRIQGNPNMKDMLALVNCVNIVLERGTYLLGIEKVEKM